MAAHPKNVALSSGHCNLRAFVDLRKGIGMQKAGTGHFIDLFAHELPARASGKRKRKLQAGATRLDFRPEA